MSRSSKSKKRDRYVETLWLSLISSSALLILWHDSSCPISDIRKGSKKNNIDIQNSKNSDEDEIIKREDNSNQNSGSDWILNWAIDHSTSSKSAQDKVAGILAQHDKSRSTFCPTKVAVPPAKASPPIEEEKAFDKNHFLRSKVVAERTNESSWGDTIEVPAQELESQEAGSANIKSTSEAQEKKRMGGKRVLNPYQSLQAMAINDKAYGNNDKKEKERVAQELCTISLMKLQAGPVWNKQNQDPLHHNPLSSILQLNATDGRICRRKYDTFGRYIMEGEMALTPDAVTSISSLSLSLLSFILFNCDSKTSQDSAARTLLYLARQAPKGLAVSLSSHYK